MYEPESAESYVVIYPHPDEAVCGAVALSAAGIKRRMDFIIQQAAKRWPVIPMNPSPLLYRPSGLRIKPDKTLVQRTRQWLKEHLEDDPEDVQFSLLGDIIKDVLPEDRDRRCLDVIIVTPEVVESLDEDEEGELGHVYGKALREREARARSVDKALPSPSMGVESSAGVRSVFKANGHLFHAGRPAGNYGPPVAIFDPALGLLAYRLSHLDDDDLPEIRPDHEECKWAHNAEDQRIAIKEFLESLDTDIKYRHSKSPDFYVSGCLGAAYGAMTGFPYGVMELKKEAGLGGDASLQAQLSYAKIVSEDTEKVRKASNCPAVVIGVMGDVVEIGIAVYTDGPYSDYVFSSGRMRLGYQQDVQVRRIARAFKAVKLALADLRRLRSQTLPADPPPTRTSRARHVLFPKPVPEPSWQGHMPTVTFTHRMSRAGELFLIASTDHERSSGLYVGTMPILTANLSASASSTGTTEPVEVEVEVIVKFTAEYNEHAHRLLAAAGFAPALHACVPVCGGVKMIVMDRVRGEMAWCVQKRDEPLPLTVYEDVRSAIELLHGEGLVFGDLRPPNVMCVPRGSASGEAPNLGAMLVDFDWVGRADEGRYPVVLNDDLGIWPPGVERGGIMRKDHDLYFLERIQDLCRVVD
ncbi:hypothetical protein L226DRAFT_548375 [Lentinus tigrinus ALCF2SS1-7]|uniref:uncharacterized protein n=1 Tax=Lentinus tigrinus ALCF2SS1-7 TaxID=1328758 RepID=UPI0011663C1F|nr:hypothetical protein L226DRAFT_548375 [Lentinus tigrinus ALCF2SS1-7]